VIGTCALTAALLAGCGGDDDDEAAAATTTTTTSEDAFCADAREAEDRLAELGEDAQLDPSAFREVSDTFDGLAEEAPDEIASDMDALASAFRALADVIGDVDLGDPDSFGALQEEAGKLQEQFGDLEQSLTDVQTYLRDECGIDLDDSLPTGGLPGAGVEEGSTTTSEG
jgi:hypothetical protein